MTVGWSLFDRPHLAAAAPAVQAEIVRLAAACETVLPTFARPGGLLRRLAPLR